MSSCLRRSLKPEMFRSFAIWLSSAIFLDLSSDMSIAMEVQPFREWEDGGIVPHDFPPTHKRTIVESGADGKETGEKGRVY